MEYTSHYGTIFTSEKMDLSTPLQVKKPYLLGSEMFASDCVEFGAWHALQIHPTLNGFQGYDCLSPAIKYC